MRRCLILIVAAACVIAGCGSGSSSSGGPLSSELSYLPSNSPLVLTVETDANGPAIRGGQALLGRFAFASLGIAALKSKLQQSGINYDGDVRPLLGNPVAFALTGSAVNTRLSSALVVWVTKDAGKLKSLLQKAVPGLHATGSRDGATLYSTGGQGAVALDGATLIAGSSSEIVGAALDRHAHGGGVPSAQYQHALAALPQDAIVKSFGDLGSVLAQPSAANARRVPWVAAIRGYAFTVTASSSGLTFSYHLDTTGAPLTPSQLPFAQGPTAPALVGSAPISVGIHDPAQIVSFIESAQQAASPGSYATFLRRQSALRAKTGSDLNGLVKLMTGDLIIASDTKTTMARATLTDPAAAVKILDGFTRGGRNVFGPAPLVKLGSADYAIVPSHGNRIFVSVVGNQLIAGGASVSAGAASKAVPNTLHAFAAAPTAPAPGTQGAVTYRITLNQLLTLALKQAPPQIVQSVLAQLTDIIGSNSVSPSGLTGRATIGVR